MRSFLLLTALLLHFCSLALNGQTNLRVAVQTGTGVAGVAEGSTITLTSEGAEAQATFIVSNAGTTPITINQVAISGTNFSLAGSSGTPATINGSGSYTFTVRYVPVPGSQSSGQVSISYTQAAVARTFSFALLGASPDLTFSFLSPSGGTTALTPGGRISFPATRLQSSQSGALIVTNQGTGPATLTATSLAGSDFAVNVTVPLTVGPGQPLSIPIVFSPQARGVRTGGIDLRFGSLRAAFALDGIGAAPEFVASYTIRADSNTRPLPDGATLSFLPTPATTAAFADVVILNQGTVAGAVRGVSISGNAFSLSGVPLLPGIVEPNQSLRFAVQFLPRQLGSFSGTLRIELEDRVINATLAGTTSSPSFNVLYVDPATRNTLQVGAGGTLVFPATAVGANTTFTVVVRNEGQGTGFINGISLSGSAFLPLDIPALPIAIESGRELRFGLQYAPRQRQADTGILTIDALPSPITIPLRGSAISPELTYEAVNAEGVGVALLPGSELAISALVRQTTTMSLRVTNRGNSDAPITSITVSGTGFQLDNVPFQPSVLRPNATQTFDLIFAPTEAVVSRGRLRIGNDEFVLTGTGIGGRLSFSYSNDAGTSDLTEGGVILLPPTRVGESSLVEVSVRNNGTSATPLSTLDVSSPDSSFRLERTPALPSTLNPGAVVSFALRFAPATTGNIAGTLRVNNVNFSLSGNAQQPVSVPEIRLQGPTGVVQPLQQPTVSLSLVSPYALPLRGALTLEFTSEVFAVNPAVQFATGGRTVAFTIPANSTQAVFETGASEIRLQTGTVAGRIALTPTVSTLAGLDVTPQAAPVASLTINREAPRLLSVAVAERSANTLNLVISGYSTTRSLRTMNLQLVPRESGTFANTNLTFDVQAASLVWFESAASQSFGGLFTITVPLRFQRGSSTEDLVQHIRSLDLTAANEVGSSNSLSLNLQ